MSVASEFFEQRSCNPEVGHGCVALIELAPSTELFDCFLELSLQAAFCATDVGRIVCSMELAEHAIEFSIPPARAGVFSEVEPRFNMFGCISRVANHGECGSQRGVQRKARVAMGCPASSTSS